MVETFYAIRCRATGILWAREQVKSNGAPQLYRTESAARCVATKLNRPRVQAFEFNGKQESTQLDFRWLTPWEVVPVVLEIP